MVTEIEPSFFEAIYQFRSVVDPLAVRLGTPRITEKTIVRGRSLVEHGAIWWSRATPGQVFMPI